MENSKSELKYELFDLEHDLSTIANAGLSSSDWMVAANAQSAQGLAEMVHEARITQQPGVVARYHEGEVKGHSAPAHLILRAAYEFNDAVIAVANSLAPHPLRKLDDSTREKYGLQIRPLMAGSIQIDLVCPDSLDKAMDSSKQEIIGQTIHPHIADVESETEKALERVLHVLESVSTSESGSSIADKVADFPPAAWGKLVRMATRCTLGDFTIDFSDRIEEKNAEGSRKSFSFTPANAAFLKSYVESKSLAHDQVDYVGVWKTVSTVRNVFDLQTFDGQQISGKVPDELVPTAAQYFERAVSISVKESTGDEVNKKRELLTIAEIELPN